ESSGRRGIVCPYHAWSYDLSGDLIAAPGFRDDEEFQAEEHSLVELPVTAWGGWLFGHALHPLGDPDVPPFDEHLGELGRLLAPNPDYVRTHRMVPLAPGRTWIECSWLVRPADDGTVPDAAAAVEFWDLTNRQDWAACESVQRGLASPHFRPGPFAPNEDAV